MYRGNMMPGQGGSSNMIIILVMMMMSCVVVLIGGGWWYTNRTKEGDDCEGDDENAKYELDDKLKCKFVNCKAGYTKNSTGKCVKPQNNDTGDNGSEECQLDDTTPYIYGQCLNTVTGTPLTGDIDSCGTGRKTKTPQVKTVQMGIEGSCPDQTYAECNIPCPLECKAPDELWVPDESASCMAGTRKLGVPIDVGGGAMVTYCGEGTQIKKLDETQITDSMRGSMNLAEYKTSINLSVCSSTTSKPCEVTCTNATQPVSCPIANYDIGWLFEGGGTGTVYTKASAEALLQGNINASQLVLEPEVSRQDAIDSGAFNVLTGVVNVDLIPKGYKIKFKASSEYSTAWLRGQGCSIFVLEEAQAPRTSENCTWTETPGACYEVGCGLLEQQNFAYNQLLPAWGNGSCDRPTKQPANCTTRTVSCCDERFVGAWTTVDGYQGCVVDNGTMKREYTRTGNGTSCSNSNVKYENDDNCKYIEGVAKVVLTSSFSKGDDDEVDVPYMLFKYIDSSGTTHDTSKIKNNGTKTFDTPVKLTYMKGGLYYKGSEFNPYGAATKASVLDVNVYDRDNNLLKNFHKEYPLGFKTRNVGGHYVTDKPGSEDWQS